MRPELAALGIERRTLHVAVAVAPDLGLRAGAFDERVVRRHRSVRCHADHLAEMVAEILRLVAKTEVIAGREKEIAVRSLHDAAAEVIAARRRPFLLEDGLD